jgi:hypothetical protein
MLWVGGLGLFAFFLVLGVLGSVDWSKHSISAPRFGSELDGVYVTETKGPDGQPGQLTVHGTQFEISLPGGYSGTGNIGKVGNTVRLTNSQVYKDGYVSQDANYGPSKVDLGTLKNDGQTIEMSDDLGNPIDFMKQ